MELVSVIITTKNSSSTLERLLVSIKNQTYKNIEIILVDNFSKDRTVFVAKKFTKKVYTKGPERSAQRNFGVKKAKGKFVLVLDSDMELTSRVVESCVKTANNKFKLLIVPEKTVGNNLLAQIRNFERSMYMGDPTIEVARFFDKKIFQKYGGYDEGLTGAEDYDLPYRISKDYEIGWAKEYILHHEENVTLRNLLQKKYYYAGESAKYAEKHPELVSTQGNLLFRKAYLRSWREFIKKPILGSLFIMEKFLESVWAIAGYINSVGVIGFLKTLAKLIITE